MTAIVRSPNHLKPLFAAAAAIALATVPSITDAGGLTAKATIGGCSDEGITGTATLVEHPSKEGVKQVDIELQVSGMKPGTHAIHIHEVGTCSPCGAAKGHFDPGPASNSSPDGNHPFHMGDLINIHVKKDGTGTMKTSTTRVTLSPGPLSLFDDNGSSFIIHVKPDTYCPGGEAKGCAGGARAACGIIEKAGKPSTKPSH